MITQCNVLLQPARGVGEPPDAPPLPEAQEAAVGKPQSLLGEVEHVRESEATKSVIRSCSSPL